MVMNSVMNHQVRGNILVKLEKLYKNSLNKHNVISICAEKWGKSSFNPFTYEVMGSISHSINIMSGFFYQYLLREYISNVKIEGTNNPRYELLPECTELNYSHLGINMVTMQAEVQNKHLDLVFKDNETDEVYYVEILKRNGLEGEARFNFTRRFNELSASLSKIYPNLQSFVVYVEDDTLTPLSSIPMEKQMTGITFFNEYLGFPIEDFYSLHEECKSLLRLDKQYKDCYRWVNDFAALANKEGKDKAVIKMLDTYKKRGNSFGF